MARARSDRPPVLAAGYKAKAGAALIMMLQRSQDQRIAAILLASVRMLARTVPVPGPSMNTLIELSEK